MLRKTNFIVIFQGVRTPCYPPLDPTIYRPQFWTWTTKCMRTAKALVSLLECIGSVIWEFTSGLCESTELCVLIHIILYIMIISSFFLFSGLRCFHPLVGNKMISMTCMDKTYVDQEIEHFLQCYEDKKCQLPISKDTDS